MSERPWRNVLLIGASGFIGRAIHKKLMASGVCVIAPGEINSTGAHGNRLRIDLSKTDLSLGALASVCPDAIVHAAAAVPHSSLNDTELNAERTRQIDHNIHHLQRHWNIPCIYLSGCSLYQSRGVARCDEDGELKPPTELTPYLGAKRDGENLFRTRGDTIIFRLSSPVGAGLSTSTVVYRFIHAARMGNMLHVWGSGMREQDFIDVRDVARLIALCTRRRRFGIFNVATGTPTTMRELAENIVSIFRQGRVIVGQREDPEEGKTARYDTSRAMQAFDWEPCHSLQDSLRALHDFETADWPAPGLDDTRLS
jgi:UDP-glucose 4-epimerase